MAKKTKSVVQVTKALSKKGRLKGKNKKETRTLIGICPHHKMNKRGNVKPTIFSNDNEYCICSMCGQRFPAKFFEDEEIKDTVNAMKEMNSQNKYTSVAIGAGDQMNDYFAQTGVILENYAKFTKKLRNVAKKQSNVKSKKKKHSNGSSQYGSWGQR